MPPAYVQLGGMKLRRGMSENLSCTEGDMEKCRDKHMYNDHYTLFRKELTLKTKETVSSHTFHLS